MAGRTHAVWFGALVTVPAVLAGVTLVWPGPRLVDELQARSWTGIDRADESTRNPPPALVPTEPDEPAADQGSRAQRALLDVRLAGVLAAGPVTFAADSAALTGPSAQTVQQVAELLRAAPSVPVLLDGHVADTPGSPEAAILLSRERASVVAAALVDGGVDPGRITTRGLGASRPLSTREASRRVEISVG